MSNNVDDIQIDFESDSDASSGGDEGFVESKTEEPVPQEQHVASTPVSENEVRLNKNGKPRKPYVMTEERKAALARAQARRLEIKMEKQAKVAAGKRQAKVLAEGVMVSKDELAELKAAVKELSLKKSSRKKKVVVPVVVEQTATETETEPEPVVVKKKRAPRAKKVVPESSDSEPVRTSRFSARARFI